MSFLPNDLPSFMWGAGVGACVLFATGFLKKAGEHSFEWTKRKFTPDAGVMTDHEAREQNVGGEILCQIF